MKRVAIVIPFGYQRGGAEAMLLHMLRENAARPLLDCHLLFLGDGPIVGEMQNLGYMTQVFASPGRLRQIHRYLHTVLKLRRELCNSNVDVILSWTAGGHLYAGPSAIGLGMSVFWFLHRIPGPDRMTRIYNAIPADGIIACSPVAARAQVNLVPHRSVSVCCPAIDLGYLEKIRLQGKAYWRTYLGLPAEAPVVGMVARLDRGKGVELFISLVAQLAHCYHNELHAFLVGGADPTNQGYADRIRALAEGTGLGDRLHLLGQLRLEDVARWQCACDVAIHCATSGEAFGMAIVEAMALEKPVVASSRGGPADIIQDRVNGLLCPPEDVEKFGRLVEELLSNPGLRQALGKAARKRAQEFSPQTLLHCVANRLAGKP
jgi:glycosyltransferase involved in cell wall biosynthesis